MEPVTIAIVVPTLNEENFIGGILTDLEQQKEEILEVIIVDGQSTDKTKQVVESFSNALPIQFITHIGKNVADQRNHGASKSKAQYVFFIDADVRIDAHYIDVIKKSILQAKKRIYIPLIQPDKKDFIYRLIFGFINALTVCTAPTHWPFTTGGSMIFERQFFLDIGGFDVDLYIGEDYEILHRAKRKKSTGFIIKNPKISISVRRMAREGAVKFITNSFFHMTHLLFKGYIRKPLFDYQMGGKISS